MVNTRMLIATCCAMALLGCNEHSQTSVSGSTATPLTTDAFRRVAPNTLVSVDVRPFVQSTDFSITEVSSVSNDTVSQNSECLVSMVNDKTLSVTLAAGINCQYEYIIQDKAGQKASAKLTLFATSDEEPILPPLSHNVTVGAESLTIDLVEQLGSNFPTRYSLESSSLHVVGQDFNLGTAQPGIEPNTISYTLPVERGRNEVTYKLVSDTEPSAYKLGRIYIAISDTANTAPTITPEHYDYSQHVEIPIVSGLVTKVDLNALPEFSITDDQSWSLVHISSPTATVVIDETHSQTNTRFRIASNIVGRHDVSYIITDYQGGYSAGLMSLDISARENDKQWADVRVDGNHYKNTFIAPPRYSDVTTALSVDALWDAKITNSFAGFTSTAAESYCSMLGRIPQVSEWTRAYSRSKAGTLTQGTFDNWSTRYMYLAKSDDGSGYQLFNLADGSFSDYLDGQSAVVSCLTTHNFTIETTLNTVVANNEQHKVLEIKKVLSTDEYHVEAVAIDDGAVVPTIAVEQMDVSSQRMDVFVNGIQSGQFKLAVSNQERPEESLTSDVIHLLGDETTAELEYTFSKSPESPSQDKLIANDEDVLMTHLKLEDIHENPIVDYALGYAPNTDKIYTDMEESQMLTDQRGQLTIPFKASPSAIPSGESKTQRSFDIYVAGKKNRILIDVVHVNYFSTVELTVLEVERLYTKVKVRVLDANKQPRTASITISGGQVGSIISQAGEAYLTTLEVPVKGVEVIMSTFLDDIVGNIEFSLDGSDYKPSVETMTIERTKGYYLISSADEVGQGTGVVENDNASKARMKSLFAQGHELVCIEKANRQKPYHTYLPELTDEDIGKVIVTINRSSSWLRYHTLKAGVYFTNWNFDNGHGVNNFLVLFWDGDDWRGINEDLEPNISRCRELGTMETIVIP